MCNNRYTAVVGRLSCLLVIMVLVGGADIGSPGPGNDGGLQGVSATVQVVNMPLAGSVPDCDTDKKQNLLRYLRQLPTGDSHRMIVGQYVSVGHRSRIPGNYAEVVTRLETMTGKSPGLLEIRLFDAWPGKFAGDWALDETIKLLWDGGYMMYISLEPPNPETGMGWHIRRDPKGKQLPADLASVYTPGTPQNTRFNTNLNQAAGFLKKLEEKGIVVLFEPFNEQLGPWHWYAHNGAKKSAKLYRYTHDYFTKTKGLSNLLWVWEWHTAAPEGEIQDAFPGDEYVDIVGLSLYDSNPKALSAWGRLVALGKPVAFTEFGPKLQYSRNKESPPYFSWDNLIQMEAFKAYFPEAVFFTRWHNVWATVNQNHADEFMKDPWLIDRKQLIEDRKRYCW